MTMSKICRKPVALATEFHRADGSINANAKYFQTAGTPKGRQRAVDRAANERNVDETSAGKLRYGMRGRHVRLVIAERSNVAQNHSIAGRNRTPINLTDLYDFPTPNEPLLRRTFGLTGAEARLAKAIAHGDCIDVVADRLAIRTSTARTQLAAIFAKTGTCRQSQLVALLSRLAHIAP